MSRFYLFYLLSSPQCQRKAFYSGFHKQGLFSKYLGLPTYSLFFLKKVRVKSEFSVCGSFMVSKWQKLYLKFLGLGKISPLLNYKETDSYTIKNICFAALKFLPLFRPSCLFQLSPYQFKKKVILFFSLLLLNQISPLDQETDEEKKCCLFLGYYDFTIFDSRKQFNFYPKGEVH